MRIFFLTISLFSSIGMAASMTETFYVPHPALSREEVARQLQNATDPESQRTLRNLAKAMAPNPSRSKNPDAQLERVAHHSSTLAELPQTEFPLRKQAMEIAFLSSSTLPTHRHKIYVERMERLRKVLLLIHSRDEQLIEFGKYVTASASPVSNVIVADR